MRIFEVRVAVQPFFVEMDQAASLFVSETPFAHGHLDTSAQASNERISLELHIVEHFANRIALNNFIEQHLARGAEPHVNRVGVAEEIVKIAEDLLIRADQKRAQIVIAAVELVQGKSTA